MSLSVRLSRMTPDVSCVFSSIFATSVQTLTQFPLVCTTMHQSWKGGRFAAGGGDPHRFPSSVLRGEFTVKPVELVACVLPDQPGSISSKISIELESNFANVGYLVGHEKVGKFRSGCTAGIVAWAKIGSLASFAIEIQYPTGIRLQVPVLRPGYGNLRAPQVFPRNSRE